MTSKINKTNKGLLKRWGPVIAVLALLGAGYAAGLHEYVSVSSLVKNRQALGSFVAENLFVSAFGFVAVYAVLVALSFPGASLLTLTAGLLFGGFAGGILTVFGATLGAVAIFLIARSSLGDFLEDKAGPFINRMIDGFQKDAFQYLLTIRLTPVFPFWAVNIVPALLNMKLAPYTLATFLGIIPATFVFAFIGAGLDSILERIREEQPGCGEAGTCSFDFGQLVTTEMLLAMLGLAAISILPLIIRKLRGGKPIAKKES